MSWAPGTPIVRREIWRGVAWLAAAVVVVEDGDALATFMGEGGELGFPPSADGRPHPWYPKAEWEGAGLLMVQRSHEAYAVWRFLDAPAGSWYINLQEPFRRTVIGHDTQDLELDVVVRPDRSWAFKDEELLPERIRDGRFSVAQVDEIRRLGEAIGGILDAGEWWWERWADFVPDEAWVGTRLGAGWKSEPPTPSAGIASYRVRSDE
ncbi:MAG: DUF402 domain-containing protein [Gaiellales bacterium]